MIKPLKKYRNASILLLFVFLIQACAQVKLNAPPALPTPRDIVPLTTQEQADLSPTPTATAAIPSPTPAEILPTATFQPKVMISAVKGNLFIRRGPDMAFNPIDVLYKNSGAEVIARDVLSKWVKIKIPNSDKTGWASILTKYSQLEGDISALPELTVTDWPVPAYLRNCTYHRMYILPNQIYLTSSLGSPENEIWLYPGSYTIYDLDVPGDPKEILKVEIREGADKEITLDGLGERRQCP